MLALKVNFFVETFGYEVHIITTEGISGTPFFNFHPFVQIHDLNIHFDVWMPKYKRFLMYAYKRFLYKRRLEQCLNKIKPDITIAMLRREVGIFVQYVRWKHQNSGKSFSIKIDFFTYKSTTVKISTQVCVGTIG